MSMNVYGSVSTCLTNPKLMASLKKFLFTTALSLSKEVMYVALAFCMTPSKLRPILPK